MRLAIVAGGWHYPYHFYKRISDQALGADLFVVAHRYPELKVVTTEKLERLQSADGPLAALDREMYREYATIRDFKALGWRYTLEKNTVGDWGFFNQWLALFDYRDYDVILNCHDDTYIRRGDLFRSIMPLKEHSWLLLANSTYPEAPLAYVRGSFEFWRTELLEMLAGKIDLGEETFTREGLVDTPKEFDALSKWNTTGDPMRRYLVTHNLQTRVHSLSSYYRISPWVIEGERGFINSNVAAPWSYTEGLKAYPI